MKKYNNIDEFFKEKVSGYKVTPSDKVWNNIESEYFRERTSGARNIIILAFIALLLITGSILTWNMFKSNTEKEIVAQYQNKELVATKSINTAESNNETKTNQETKINTINEESQDIANIKKESLSNEKQIKSNLVVDKREIIELTKTIITDPKTSDDFFVDFNPQSGLSDVFQLDKMKMKNTKSIQNPTKPSILDNYNEITIDEYIERRKNLHLYTGASTSIAMTYYSNTTDQSTWTADLVYGLKLKRFYIETGIGFQKMKEQGNFQIDYKTNDSIGYYNKVVSFELNPNNPSEITYNVKTTTVYDSIKHQLLQSPLYHYNYISIPIKFGYKFYQHPKFSISAETGIIYSLLTNTLSPKVSYNDPDSQLIGITNNTPERVEHSIRVHIAIRLNYNIAKTISLNVQPEFTSFLNSIYDKQSVSNKAKPYTMGMRFGICFDF